MSSASLSPDATSNPEPAAVSAGSRPIASAVAAIFSFLKRLVLGLVVAALVSVGARYGVRAWSHSCAVETTDDAYTDAHIVPVSPRISGRVNSVKVRENQEVKKGDLLVELDPIDFKLRQESQSAGLTSTTTTRDTALKAVGVVKARLDSARAQRKKAVADVAAVKATADRTVSEYERVQKLAGSQAVSVQDVEMARAASIEASEHLNAAQQSVATADAGVLEAEALVEVAKSFIEGSDSKVRQSELSLKQAEQDLSYTRIVASEDGRVTRKGVEPGAYVQPGQNLMALVSRETWVIANFKETQLHTMHPGQPVDVKFDAYPEHPLHGHVDSIQSGSGARFSLFPPENASGNFVKVVQRVPVKIVFDDALDPKMVTGPGLSVVPEVITGREPLTKQAEELVCGGAGFLGLMLVLRRKSKAQA